MFKLKERSSFKQYLAMKPLKKGYRLCPNMNGYVCNLQIYTGKTNGQPEHNLGSKVVMALYSSLQEKFYQIHFGNYFTFVPLLHYDGEGSLLLSDSEI